MVQYASIAVLAVQLLSVLLAMALSRAKVGPLGFRV